MRRILLTAAAACLLAAGCQPATTELTDEQRAAFADTVNAANAEAWDAWREMDLDRALSYFHDSPDVGFALGGQVYHGYAEVGSFWRGELASADHVEITISDLRTMVLTADVVCLVERGVFSVTDSAGVTSPETAFALTTTWVRRDAEWKVLLAHESWPPPESM